MFVVDVQDVLMWAVNLTKSAESHSSLPFPPVPSAENQRVQSTRALTVSACCAAGAAECAHGDRDTPSVPCSRTSQCQGTGDSAIGGQFGERP